MLLLLTCLLLAACWGNEEPAPEGDVQPTTTAPVSALPTAEATTVGATAVTTTAVAAAAPTQTSVAATPPGIATLVSTPLAVATVATNSITATTPTALSTPTFTALEAEAGDDCEIESSLDLVGYPNLEQSMGCATEPAIFDPIAINEFGDPDQPTDRFMLWFSHETAIYVLLPDGTYQVHEDTWDEAVDPTYPCNPLGGEEDSPPLPRRGFGKLWCSSPGLQQILGAVPREERLCQYAVLQRFQSGRLLACFEDATIRYFRILDNGTWDLQMQ